MNMKPFEEQANFKRLGAYYKKNPIVLYVGAGISKSRAPGYGLPNWVGLLNKLCEKIAGVQAVDLPTHPWEASDRIIELCVDYLKRTGWEGEKPEDEAERRLQDALWKTVRSPENFVTQGIKHPYKLLNKEYLRNAWTLRAVAAFCAQPISMSHKGKVNRFGANRRVRAVLSGNYDPYLEAAATSMFKIPVVKPVSAFGSTAGDLRKVPVYHVHGYVPHPGHKEDPNYIPMQKELVLTRKSYDRAWDETNVFNATMISQIFLLRHYTTLFVGFSFTDPNITKLLSTVRGEYTKKRQQRRWNYAIIRADEGLRKEKELRHLGVRPIFLKEYDEIPDLLGALYTAGLQEDHPNGVLELPLFRDRKVHASLSEHLLPCAETWNSLYTCHQCTPRVFSD